MLHVAIFIQKPIVNDTSTELSNELVVYNYERNLKTIVLFLNQNICWGYSKETSQ